ncbi:hypothetical protein Tco_1274972 [Tanacetum coccineum]
MRPYGVLRLVSRASVPVPYEDLSDIGSPRADDHELLELPYMPEDPYIEAALQAPPSPDYVPGPEEPEQHHPNCLLFRTEHVIVVDDRDDEMDIEEDEDEILDTRLMRRMRMTSENGV